MIFKALTKPLLKGGGSINFLKQTLLIQLLTSIPYRMAIQLKRWNALKREAILNHFLYFTNKMVFNKALIVNI
ncbi:hypothetical protein HPHPH44_0305 [Helicobacter pylori Hp H-44]|nr:hypothetical protein HPHPH44_0305 [Helicobacter pylori Hp H-44]